MTTDAQLAANKANAALSTGPKTPAGKSRSSKNALTFGLFTMNDFLRENESEDYTKICTSLWTELTPEGTLEQTLTTEIMSATWRLRRCRMVEEDIAQIAILDPMQDPETEKQQRSVDRARAQSHSILHRCVSALRKIQTERGARSQAFPQTGPPEGLGLMDVRQLAKVKPIDPGPEPDPAPTAVPAGFDALMALADKQLAQQYRDYGLAAFTGVPTPTATLIPTQAAAQTQNRGQQIPDLPPGVSSASLASNCKPAAKPATQPRTRGFFSRNAPCPCGSGAKFKRCCGNPAATAPQMAA